MIDTPEKLKARSGEGDILHIRVNGLSKDLAAKILNSMPTRLTEKKYTDGFLFLGADDLLELIPTVSRILKTYYIRPEDMTIRKRTLEDAFIALTGRGLRE